MPGTLSAWRPELDVSTQALSPATLAPLPKGSEAAAQPRLAMRKIKDVLRLSCVNCRRQLARTVGCGKSAVSESLRRAAAAVLNRWETIAALNEAELERSDASSGRCRTGQRSAKNCPDAITR